MLKTLYAKLLAVLVGLTVIMAVMFLIVIRHSDVARNQEINQKLYGNLASRLIDEQILAERDRADPSAVQKVFDRIRVVNPRIDVYLLDSTGHVLAASVQDGLKRDTVDLEPIRRFFDENAKLPILGDDPSEAGRQRAFSVAPVPLSGDSTGYLYLVFRGFSGDTLAQQIKQSYVLRETLWLIGCGLAIALLASALIITLMTRPLRQLTVVMDKFRRSGFAEQPEALRPPQRRDRHAHRHVQPHGRPHPRPDDGAQADRRDAARARREHFSRPAHAARFAARLSRDAAAQARRALARRAAQLSRDRAQADRAAERARRAAVRSRQARFRPGRATPEPFALGDLVQDVVQEFELAASNKGMRLHSMRADLPLVIADIGLMERVLRNLIENALRYTGSGGTVTVSAAPAGDGRWWKSPTRLKWRTRAGIPELTTVAHLRPLLSRREKPRARCRQRRARACHHEAHSRSARQHDLRLERAG